jgi:uncharacterized protein YyaL (SSP411 family)
MHRDPPGTEERDAATRAAFREAVATKGPGYRARTHHLESDGTPRFTNRLVHEASPYLLQHAHNPVDWHPWGEEAFALAAERGCPVFLSIGYSTCHWCHVMEEESFEDEDIAAYMNAEYVCIKVDREERPDVDAIYMTAVQALTGHGGWPMSVWLTPERLPYYGGTYFPARDGDRGMRTGFFTILQRLRSAFADEAEKVADSAAQVAEAIKSELAADRSGALASESSLHKAFRIYEQRWDPRHGGLRVQQKFPSQLSVRMALRYARRFDSELALRMADVTLRKMAGGGLYDQVGGGFHRYSTDPHWLVPHFEKMLYDNALLVSGYLEAWQSTGDEDFANTARDVLRYVERDMTSDSGAFFSATDADSMNPSGKREEGWFFTWTPQELSAELEPELYEAAMRAWAVEAGGNFEGRSILHLPRPLDAVAAEMNLDPAELRARLDRTREILYAARSERPPPLRDEKILTAWNGLMISACAQAAFVLDEPRWAALAARAADDVLSRCRVDGELMRAEKDGVAKHPAVLDDLAFLCAGLLDLFEATGEGRWLDEAIGLDRALQERFEDADAGGFFLAPAGREDLLVRDKPAYDGAEPSGNSVHALSLLRLAAWTTDDDYRRRAVACLQAFGRVLEETPGALSEMLLALDFLLEPPKEIVIVAPSDREGAQGLLDVVRRRFLPAKVVVVAGQDEVPALTSRLGLLEGKVAIDGKATAYVCRQGACALPVTSAAELAEQLDGA